MNWAKGDEVAERIAIVELYELGLGTQEELAEIFQMHVNSIAKYISTFKADGAGGLVSQSPGPKEGWRLTPEVRAKILFKVIKIETQEGYSLDEICLTLFYFDLFRYESMENFKTAIPDEFGILIGRLSSPSIYTLRRFLHEVKELNKSEELIEELEGGKLRVQLRRFRNPEIDYAVRRLCEDLNQVKPFTLDKFHLPLHYEVI